MGGAKSIVVVVQTDFLFQRYHSTLGGCLHELTVLQRQQQQTGACFFLGNLSFNFVCLYM